MNKSAIYESFLQNQRALKSFISGFMSNSSDIEDVAQEVFIRAYKHDSDKSITYPKAYLYRIAKNLALNEVVRCNNRITDYIDDIESSYDEPRTRALEDDIAAQQKLGLVCQSIAALPPKCREAVLLKKVHGFSVKEIAEQMNIAESTVEKHLYKGMLAVNKQNKQQLDTERSAYKRASV